MPSRTLKVEHLARVEGEGKLVLTTRGREVVEAELHIYEPPRFFEALLAGREPGEAIDITSRICGICPVAYQLTAAQALEGLGGVSLTPALRALRRLLYCGEWIESHALHVVLLHAPDFLGLADVVELARLDRGLVERALELKKLGNELVRVIGGREVHPINVAVGGFYSAPAEEKLRALLPLAERGLAVAQELIGWVSGFDFPTFDDDYEYVALSHPGEYAMTEGRLRSTHGLDADVSEFPAHFEESQVRRSNALHCRRRGGGVYSVGPLARVALNHAQLTPLARSAAVAAGLDQPCRNPFRSIVARAVELIFACEESLRLLSEYRPPEPARLPLEALAGTGAAATEAPRGLLYHRYEVAPDGLLKAACIVPPTAQNQARIEQDLRLVGTAVLDLPAADATWRCEQAIRNYDPCISCATHFLSLRWERT